ncbi:MAG: OmpA family protein [Alphaproteobacteria bacterium]|nr:OmpA family protein [Alphaproteobacteria bacterium]
MEGFLSLPRFAKGGIAVLLAVALLGWGIVAYSAKRQHEDARSLEQAIATLKSQGDREQTTLSEQTSLEERLAATEAELATSREALAAGREEKGAIEVRLVELEAALAAARKQPEGTPGQGGALALLGDRDVGDGRGDRQSALVDAETLHTRLTKTMTSLSAKNATLQQRERDLARALARADAADSEIEELAARVDRQEAMRSRLTGMMTELSAKNAMLQQRDRELEHARGDHASAEETIASLETALAERDESGRSLDALTAKLAMTKQTLDDGAKALESNQDAVADQMARLQDLKDEQASIEAVIGEKQAEIEQREQKLAGLADGFSQEEQQLTGQRQEIEVVKTELANLAAAREESEQESSRLIAEIDSLEATLNDKEDAIAHAETVLERLEGEIAGAEQQLADKEAELEGKLAVLNARDVQIQGAEASLAAVKADRAMAEAETVELKTTVDRQEAALQELAVLKSELDATKAELADQTALLDEKRGEVAAAEAGVAEIKGGLQAGSVAAQSLPRIPIADLSADEPAVLPVDPTQIPYPVQTELGVRLALVHFDLGSAELTPGGLRRAKEAAAWIKQQDIQKIRLVGATDTIGTRENNMALAKRRARTLFDMFAAEGVDPGRIELISMGEAGGGEAIADQTAEPLNRCVGVFIGG